MNGHPTNEEREALIADEGGKSLAPGEADELALLAGLLGDQSTWAEPPTGLADASARDQPQELFESESISRAVDSSPLGALTFDHLDQRSTSRRECAHLTASGRSAHGP